MRAGRLSVRLHCVSGDRLPKSKPLLLAAEVSDAGRLEVDLGSLEAASTLNQDLSWEVASAPGTAHRLKLALYAVEEGGQHEYCGSGSQTLERVEDEERLLNLEVPLVDEVGKHLASVRCSLRFYHSRVPGKVRDPLGRERIDEDLLSAGAREAARLMNERSPHSPRAKQRSRSVSPSYAEQMPPLATEA